MKTLFHLLCGIVFLQLVGCLASKPAAKPKPAWVTNRPVHQSYYTGIGIASKNGAMESYQQTAKKNALSDLIGEIRVKVSAQSALSQYQSNAEFKQKFESETKITAMNSIDHFEVVDSWEDKDYFWVYYRLSKAEYEAMRRKKMQMAMDISEELLNRADALDISNSYTQILQTRLKAITAIQAYLGEELVTEANGQTFNLANRITSAIQEQLNRAVVKPLKNDIHIGLASAESEALEARIVLKTGEPVAQLPFRAITSRGHLPMINSTGEDGKLVIDLNGIGQAYAIQSIRIQVDLLSLCIGDSLNIAAKEIISSFIPPSATIRVQQQPLLVYIASVETNMAKPFNQKLLENTLKNKFANNNILVIDDESKASIRIKINAEAKSIGTIYKTMQGARVDGNIAVFDSKTNTQLYSNTINDIRGYQNTVDGAGQEAFKYAAEYLQRDIFPALLNKISVTPEKP